MSALPAIRPELLRRPAPVPHGEEFGEIGFTDKDRRSLITLEANYENIYKLMLDFRQTLERRLDRLEAERALKEDVIRIETAINRELSEKADRKELSDSAAVQALSGMNDLRTEVQELKTKLTWAYAWAAGVASVVGFVFWILRDLKF